MGIRETISRYPTQTTIGAALLLVTSVALGAYYGRGPSGPRPVAEAQAYFSNDDGKTWFADLASKPSPFDRDGKPAYRVYAWRCNGGKPFVSHLQRAVTNTVPTDDTGGRGAPAPTAARRTPPALAGAVVEVKRPGDANWTLANTVEGEAIAQPRCPDGSTAGLEPVEP